MNFMEFSGVLRVSVKMAPKTWVFVIMIEGYLEQNLKVKMLKRDLFKQIQKILRCNFTLVVQCSFKNTLFVIEKQVTLAFYFEIDHIP